MSKTAEDPLTALANAPARSPKQCVVARLIEVEEQRESPRPLRYLVEESEHSAQKVAAAARSAGLLLSAESVRVHRRGACICSAAS